MPVLAPCGSPRAIGRGPSHAAADPAPEGVRVHTAEIGDVPPCHEGSGPRGWPAPGAASRDRFRGRDVAGSTARVRRVGPAAEGRPWRATPPAPGGPARRP